jgi:hypothetical protein
MHFRISRTLAGAGRVAALAVLMAACKDARIAKLSTGISRDSALKVINEGAAGDSLARVYKQETYLINGQTLNVLFYNKDGIKQASDSSLEAKAQTPIVVASDKVTGWGWDHYDSVATANNIKPSPHP